MGARSQKRAAARDNARRQVKLYVRVGSAAVVLQLALLALASNYPSLGKLATAVLGGFVTAAFLSTLGKDEVASAQARACAGKVTWVTIGILALATLFFAWRTPLHVECRGATDGSLAIEGATTTCPVGTSVPLRPCAFSCAMTVTANDGRVAHVSTSLFSVNRLRYPDDFVNTTEVLLLPTPKAGTSLGQMLDDGVDVTVDGIPAKLTRAGLQLNRGAPSTRLRQQLDSRGYPSARQPVELPWRGPFVQGTSVEVSLLVPDRPPCVQQFKIAEGENLWIVGEKCFD